MSIEALKEDLKNGNPGKLYLFYGPEEYLKKYYMESIEKRILSEEYKGFNRIVLEGRVETGKIMDCCDTLPVFSDRKLVVVKNSGLMKSGRKSGGEGKTKPQNDDLASYLQSLPDYVCLIFYEEEIDKRVKLVDTVKKHGLVVEFSFQKPAELVKWVVKVFKSFQKEIDNSTAAQLVDNCEQGMNELLNEIRKLELYTGERKKVTGEDIDRVCTRTVKSRIFDLTDAIAEKNTTRALKLFDDMIVLKEPIPRILFMITRQFRHILEMKLITGSGASLDSAASRMGITTYAAGKIQKQMNRFTEGMLKQAIEESLELDIAIKTGKLNDRTAAELLITKYAN